MRKKMSIAIILICLVNANLVFATIIDTTGGAPLFLNTNDLTDETFVQTFTLNDGDDTYLEKAKFYFDTGQSLGVNGVDLFLFDYTSGSVDWSSDTPIFSTTFYYNISDAPLGYSEAILSPNVLLSTNTEYIWIFERGGYSSSDNIIAFAASNAYSGGGSGRIDNSSTAFSQTVYDNDNNLDLYFKMEFSGNAVPEPATILLFGIGLLGLSGVNRRKK